MLKFKEFCLRENPSDKEWWGNPGERTETVQLKMADLMAKYMDYIVSQLERKE